MSHIRAFFKKEPVLAIAAIAAVLSMFLVPPSAAYIDYIDIRVLCLLFCLMAVVAGLQSCGLFDLLAQRLLAGKQSLRRVVLLLVLLPFFSSMLVTNDVALLVFVPFTLPLLKHYRQTAFVSASRNPLGDTFRQLGRTLRDARKEKHIFLYLIAFFFFINGVYTIIDIVKTAMGGDDRFKRFIPLIACVLGAVCGVIAFYFVPGVMGTDNLQDYG